MDDKTPAEPNPPERKHDLPLKVRKAARAVLKARLDRNAKRQAQNLTPKSAKKI